MQIIKIGLSNKETKGCEKAPDKIIQEFKNIGSNENGELIEHHKLNLEEIHIDLKNLKEADYLIFDNTKEIFEKNFHCFFIGGDQSMSYPILRAFNRTERNPLLVIFDSHADCLDKENVKSRKWLRDLVEEGFNPSNIILISTRNMWKDEADFLNENKILVIKMNLLREDLDGICDLIMERAMNSSGFYISVDISSVDPGFAPGTNFLEPGGLSSSDLIYFIRRLKLLKNFRGGDISEINPDRDLNNMTVRLGAKILAEMV